RSMVWAVVLGALSALFAAAVAWVTVRLVRRDTRLLIDRASELEEFAGRVAHDIRDPLTPIGVALELAQRRAGGDVRSRETADAGLRSLGRIVSIVDGLLGFARAGARPSADAWTDVRAVVDEVVGELRPSAEAAGIVLWVEPCPRCAV